ncbi:unnamed protein product, partial [Prorocentrum cordatum]
VQAWFATSALRALAVRVVQVATLAGRAARASRAAVLSANAGPSGSTSCAPAASSAEALAAGLDRRDPQQAGAEFIGVAAGQGAPGLGSSLRQVAAIQAVARAQASGKNPLHALRTRAACLKLESRQHSLRTTASGLRAWHQFAAAVLHYPESSILQPKSPTDMEAFIFIIFNFGIASNCVSSVKWACLQLRLDTSRFDGAIVQLLRGGKKRDLRAIGVTIKIQTLLNAKLVTQLVALAGRSRQFVFATLLLFSWEFLAMVSSEAVPAEWGDAREAMVDAVEALRQAVDASDTETES